MKRSLWLAGLGAIALNGCGIKEEIYNAKVAELNKTKAALEQEQAARKACDKKQAELDAEAAALKAQLAALGQDMSSTKTDLEKAKKRVEELRRAQEQAEKRAAQFRDMVAKFKSMIDAGKLQVEFRDGLILVKLPDNILFDSGKTDLKPAGQEAIKQVTVILASIQGRKFQVTGHTDNIPIKSKKFASNWELSTARAVEVVRFMINNGMESSHVSAAGFGEFDPIGDNADDSGRQQNRRIEIIVMPNVDELPKLDEGELQGG